MAPLRYAAKFDPFLYLDCGRVEGVGTQGKEGNKFCHLATLRANRMRKESRNPITEAVNYGRPAAPAEGGKEEEVESDSGKKATKLFYGKEKSCLLELSLLLRIFLVL